MTRWTAVALLSLCAALAAVLAGAVRMIQRDRQELVERFAAERLRLVDEAAREIRKDLDDVAASLRFGGQLLQADDAAGDSERELRVLLAAAKSYLLIQAYDAAGTAILSVGERPAGARGAEAKGFEAALTDTARRALGRPPGEIQSSPTLSATGKGWFRVFATSFARAPAGKPSGAIAALVEMERLFDTIHLIASDGSSRVLLVGGVGDPTASSDGALAAALAHMDASKPDASRFARLVSRMRAGERGSLAIDEREAAQLGLERAEVIAAFTSIPGEAAEHWSVATLSTTAPLRAHDQSLVMRLGFAAGLAVLLLSAFGAYLIVVVRREVALRERLRHADALFHLHEKTEKILDNIPTGVIALSDRGTITAINRALHERCPESALGGRLGDAFPEAPTAVVARLEALIASALSSENVRSLHGERLSLFGEEGQYSLHAVPLERGFPEARVLLVVEDVSEVRSLASQLLRAEKLATIGVLSAGIAHEIGTPLGVVRGRAEYILGKLGAGHAQAPGLQVIVEQIDRVSRIIRQLLDFARVKPAQVRPVQVAPVARAVAELLRFEAERRRLELAVDVPESLAAVAADPDQLQQVLVNLVMNACDACREGGHVTIAARPASTDGARPSDGWSRLRIEVVDDGCGIPEEHRLQVFDPFFTTKKRGQGTGLGLTMSAEIARNHGAEIELESEPDKGTRITLLWPTAAQEAERVVG